jgi:Membrane-bound serine protease (ClpP class)
MPKRRQTRADGRPRSGGQRPRGTSAGRPGGPGGRPAVADRPSTPGASERRRAVERFSARPLVFLHQMPRWALLLIVLGLLISGFAVPGLIGAVALLLVAILLGWLAYLSWPSINASGRVLRVIALACMVAIVVWQAGR